MNEINTKTLNGVRVSSVSTRVMTENSVAMVIEVNLRAKTPARSAHIFRMMVILSLEKREVKMGYFDNGLVYDICT